MNPRQAVLFGAILGALGVTIGAFHAHGMEKFLAGFMPADVLDKRMEQAEVGIRYQMLHALALLAIGALGRGGWSKCLAAAAVMIAAGSVVFSGSLYLIVLLNKPFFGAIAPIGGLLLIVGWLAAAAHACCCWNGSGPSPTSAPEA